MRIRCSMTVRMIGFQAGLFPSFETMNRLSFCLKLFNLMLEYLKSYKYED